MVKHHPNSLTMWSCRCLLPILNLTRLQRRNRSIHLFLTLITVINPHAFVNGSINRPTCGTSLSSVDIRMVSLPYATACASSSPSAFEMPMDTRYICGAYFRHGSSCALSNTPLSQMTLGRHYNGAVYGSCGPPCVYSVVYWWQIPCCTLYICGVY